MISLLQIRRLFFASLKDYRLMNQRSAYREILGVSPHADLKEIKQMYHQLVKTYHPDAKNSLSEEQTKINDEICRIVINAFNELSKQQHGKRQRENKPQDNEDDRAGSSSDRSRGWSSKYDSDYEPKSESESQRKKRAPQTDEQILYHSIFGKLFEEDPYLYYNEKNAHLRMQYERKLSELRAKKGWKPKAASNQDSSFGSTENQPQTKERVLFGILLGFGCVSVAAFLVARWMFPKKKEVKPIRNITEQRIQEILNMSAERRRVQYEKLLKSYHQQHPPMLKYPSEVDPGILQQLLKYSVLTDISVYQTDPNFFYNHEKFVDQKIPDDKLLLINHVKPNTLMTMALEAERCLHNIYVNRKDLLKSLQEKGKYDPPGIFFRFYGFNYLKIRQGMPLNLSNVGNEEWISLFDLYFKYYSPLLVKKSDYYEYTSYYGGGKRDKPSDDFLGSVHLNHRSIPNIFLRPEDKNAFMWVGGKSNKKWQEKYRGIWTDYYRRRESFW